jgi:hypothetical protein
MDGIAEVTFPHAWLPLLGLRHRKRIDEDEPEVFERS